jgi:glucose-1-phosphate thymidylyltransferase
VKCLILAAGYATRLYPLTENFPKPLLPVEGKTILEWLLDDLSGDPEIDEFIVISNHKFAGHFEEWAKTVRYPVRVLDDGTETNETRLGAVRDIQFALNHLDHAEDVLVMAGDNLLDFSLRDFLTFAREKGASCVMCHEERDLKRQQKTAIITVDESAKITSYEEKPVCPKGNLAVPPFYFYRAEDAARVGEALEQGCKADAPGSFAAWMCMRVPMYAYVMPGKRYDIGDVESYETVKKIWSGKS